MVFYPLYELLVPGDAACRLRSVGHTPRKMRSVGHTPQTSRTAGRSKPHDPGPKPDIGNLIPDEPIGRRILPVIEAREDRGTGRPLAHDRIAIPDHSARLVARSWIRP